MIDLEAIDWARLAAPSPMFRVFREPTAEQLSSIVTRLLNDYLYAPDELQGRGDDDTARQFLLGRVEHHLRGGRRFRASWGYWTSCRNTRPA